MKIENRQQFLIVVVAVIVGLLVANSLIFQPLASLWSARAKQIKNLSSTVSDGKRLVSHATDTRGEWDRMRANMLPDDTAVAEQKVLKALDTWALSSRATITGIMRQWKNDSADYQTLSCRVEATGNLGMLTQFLYDIEKDPMALKLESVELSAHDTGGQVLTLALQISGLVLNPQKR